MGFACDDALGVRTATEQRAAAVDERGAPLLRVEADAVAREQPLVDRVADVAREHRPRVRADPRDVREVRDARLGPRRTDERRDEVEVVVLDEDRRVRETVELLDDGRRKRPVCLDVALAPGRAEVGSGILLQVPQTVLDEPQHGVRDHAVEAPVHLGVVRHQAQRERRARRRLLRAASGSRRSRARPRPSRSRPTSRRSGRPAARRAVTRPPAPRDASIAPAEPRRKPTGPRFETTISGPRRAITPTRGGCRA